MSTDFLIGLLLALSSCLFIGSSFIFKKIGLIRLRGSSSTPASEGGHGYLKDWVWWTGLLTMGVGEAANFAAYAYAPASLVTPLGALSILVSAVLASKLLQEHMNLLGKLGCVLCILGSIIVVIHSPKEGEVKTVAELTAKIVSSGFVYYVVMVVIAAVLTAWLIVPRYGKTYVFVYIYICASIGSLSVMCCKGIGLCIRESLAGQSPLITSTFVMFIAALVTCLIVQMNYLNKSLDTFNTAVVNPLHYVLFTTSVILASSILFEEWRFIPAVDVIATTTGLLVIIIALFILNAFKDIQISSMDLYTSRSQRSNY